MIFGFDLNIKLLEFIGGPWWPAALLVWVHVKTIIFDVFLYIGLSCSAAMFAWMILYCEFLFVGFWFLVGCISLFHGFVHG